MITLFPPKAIKKLPSKKEKKALNARKICAPTNQNKKGIKHIYLFTYAMQIWREGCKLQKVESCCG